MMLFVITYTVIGESQTPSLGTFTIVKVSVSPLKAMAIREQEGLTDLYECTFHIML